MLTVRDIMRARVVTVAPDTTVRHLARMLADEEISGVPVVAEDGALLGVVSATDIVRLAATDDDVHLAASTPVSDSPLVRDPDDGADEDDPDPYGFFLPEDSPFVDERILERFTETELDTVTVQEIMTPVTFSVEADTPVQELADFLVRGRIHRAVVLEGEELAGIVTSGDVLRAVSEGKLG